VEGLPKRDVSNKSSQSCDLDVIRVLVGDQQRLFSSALAAALGQERDLLVLDERPSSAHEAVEAAAALQPDVALLDYWMEGPTATERIQAVAPGCRVMLVSWLHAPGQVKATLSAGAVGFLPKSLKLAQIAVAIRNAYAGQSPVYREELRDLVEKIDRRYENAEDFGRRVKELTPRELQILLLLSQARLIQDIARELAISQATVTVHINRILKKTGARSHAEVLAMARAAGTIQT